MLVCLQFAADANARMAGLGLDRCNVLPHLIVCRTMSPLHSDYERVTARTVAELENGSAPMAPALEVFDLSAVCPLRHKGLLCWRAYGSSVG
jgi:hypothetical protein